MEHLFRRHLWVRWKFLKITVWVRAYKIYTDSVNSWVVVDQDGFIVSFDHAETSSKDISLTSEVVIPRGSFILPTFCDLHLHAPQYLYQGNGLDLPLMQWLDTYALKAEEQLDSDHILARRVYKKLAKRLLTNGTGAVLLFGTIKEDTKCAFGCSPSPVSSSRFV